MKNKIVVKGAKENNLKGINVEIPRDKLVVFTGLSGSGKSSLAFDTIYAEGRRRYVESLSSYARQFLGQMEKPNVEYIEGLSPAISIDQKTTSRNPRSTVGTVTEIYDYLRLLYARVGVAHCHKCGKEIQKQSLDQIIEKILKNGEGVRLQILAPIVTAKKGEHVKIFEKAKKDGFVRVRVDGEMRLLEEEIKLEKTKKHTIEVIVDRIKIKDGIYRRIADSVETALHLGGGIIHIIADEKEETFSEHYACHDCGVNLEELSPRSFSFNAPFGSCPTCAGLGSLLKINPERVLRYPERSIKEGAIQASGWYVGEKLDSIAMAQYKGLAKHYGFSLDTPVCELPEKIVNILLYGSGMEKIEFSYDRESGGRNYKSVFEGIIPNLERRHLETSKTLL